MRLLGGRALLGAALGIAGVTVLARAVGFGRVGVLSRTLGTSCVGSVYQAVNSLPNVVFEVAAGGALATLVVPLLAPAVDRGDRAQAGATASALLTWTVLLLTPVALAGALLAEPLVRTLLGDEPACAGAVETGSRLLVVFMPQVVLYGIGIVLAGVLQAQRRFYGPALAPLLSSLVVIGAYLLYAALGRATDLQELSRTQELVLSAGTTLGVAVLSLSLLVPLRRSPLPLRPTLAFPPGVAARARALAGGGIAGLVAQQVALVVALRLAWQGGEPDVVVFTVATAVFLLPWAVLAVPVATSVFPVLAARADQPEAYREVAGRALRAVLVLTLGAAALLVVVALPAARVLVLGAPGVDSTEQLAAAVVAFAPGLVGYGLLALLTRALFARGDARTPALATVTGWAVVAVTDVALVAALPAVDRVVLLGVGNTVGMTVAGLLLLRGIGGAVVRGTGRAAVAGLVGAVAAVALGLLLPVPRDTAPLPSVGTGVLLALAAGAAFVVVVRLLDPAGTRELVRRAGE